MTADVNSYVEQAVTTSGGAEKGVYSLAVTMNRDGGASHPSVAGHKVMAEEISSFINDLENPDEPELPEGTLFYEDFENITDVTKVIYDVAGQSWTHGKINTTNSVSGSKSFSIFGMHQNTVVPLDKALFEDGTIYEFSLNWKLKAYDDTKKYRLTAVQLVGWNPSEVKVFKNNYTRLSGDFSEIKATGNWENTSIRFLKQIKQNSAFTIFPPTKFTAIWKVLKISSAKLHPMRPAAPTRQAKPPAITWSGRGNALSSCRRW